MHVLIVEDSITQARVHELNLSRYDFAVSKASTVSEAEDCLADNEIDVVLLDLNLPDSKGLDTFFHVHQAARGVPIVLVSSIADEAIAMEALQGGAQDYLIKGQAHDREIKRCLVHAVERSRVEKQLRESERRTRMVLENCTDAFIACDRNGVIRGWNPQAENMFGWKKDEVVGKTLSETIIPDYLQETHKHDLATLASSDRGSLFRRRAELRLKHRNGAELPVELGLFPILIGDDHDELCAFVHDITARKAIEMRNKQLNEELEQRVAERTAELARSNAELQQFAKVASHDLQEPLRAVEGYVRLLTKRYKGKLDQDADEFIDFIMDGVDRMGKLIQAVLAHASIGPNDVKNVQQVDCKIVISEVLSNLKATIEESNAKVVIEKMPVVMANRSEMLQLFQNLLSNALKYKGDRPPEITVRAEQNVHEWVFSIQDNGIGIDPRYTEKIFDMFARLHGKTSYSGTGIGLAICKKIVETHGGRIWVQSEPGAGSIFFFSLDRDPVTN